MLEPHHSSITETVIHTVVSFRKTGNNSGATVDVNVKEWTKSIKPAEVVMYVVLFCFFYFNLNVLRLLKIVYFSIPFLCILI